MGAMKALYTEMQEDARMEAAAALVRAELGGIDWDAAPRPLGPQDAVTPVIAS